MKKLTQEEWINKAKEVHNNFYDYSKVNYVNSRTKVCIICPIHGEFWQEANGHLQGRGCDRCAKPRKYDKSLKAPKTNRKRINPTVNKEEFITQASIKHDNKYNYSKVQEFRTMQDKVIITCPIHGDFEQSVYNHLYKGYGCPRCARELVGIKCRSNTENFMNKALKIHGNKYIYSKVNYIDQYTPVTIICPEHGEFQQVPKDHIRKDRPSGCPKCLLKSQYILYNKICECFPSIDIKYEYSPEWLGLQRFDIYIPKYNIAIEYNGKQHYVPIKFFGGEIGLQNTQERDKLKRDKCKNNNCTLFELPYNYKENDFQNLVNSINLIINNYEN